MQLSDVIAKAQNGLKSVWNGIKNVYRFGTDWRYRTKVIENHWNWKTKILAYFVLPVVLVVMVFHQPIWAKTKKRSYQFYQCVMEDWDTGRETEFNLISGNCVIDSGRKDATGQVIWQQVKRDMVAGE